MNVSSDVQKAHLLFAPCVRERPATAAGVRAVRKAKDAAASRALVAAAKSEAAAARSAARAAAMVEPAVSAISSSGDGVVAAAPVTQKLSRGRASVSVAQAIAAESPSGSGAAPQAYTATETASFAQTPTTDDWTTSPRFPTVEGPVAQVSTFNLEANGKVDAESMSVKPNRPKPIIHGGAVDVQSVVVALERPKRGRPRKVSTPADAGAAAIASPPSTPSTRRRDVDVAASDGNPTGTAATAAEGPWEAPPPLASPPGATATAISTSSPEVLASSAAEHPLMRRELSGGRILHSGATNAALTSGHGSIMSALTPRASSDTPRSTQRRTFGATSAGASRYGRAARYGGGTTAIIESAAVLRYSTAARQRVRGRRGVASLLTRGLTRGARRLRSDARPIAALARMDCTHVEASISRGPLAAVASCQPRRTAAAVASSEQQQQQQLPPPPRSWRPTAYPPRAASTSDDSSDGYAFAPTSDDSDDGGGDDDDDDDGQIAWVGGDTDEHDETADSGRSPRRASAASFVPRAAAAAVRGTAPLDSAAFAAALAAGDAWPAARVFKVPGGGAATATTATQQHESVATPPPPKSITLLGLGLPPLARTSSGWPAATAVVLRELAAGPAAAHFGGGSAGEAACAALRALHSVSTIDTMLSNFIVPLQTMADEKGRVHCSLNLNTETGRLSARRPNLQNQPALEKDRYGVRAAFRAPPGMSLVVADYGQLELRLLAHMARCRSMVDAFAAGGDFHSRTAAAMYPHVAAAISSGAVALEEGADGGGGTSGGPPLVKSAFPGERRRAKVLNFSIAYGKTAVGLARDWGVPLNEARATLEAWFADRPEVRAWQAAVLDAARREGATRTLLGRYRDLPDLASPELGARRHAERAAINTPIQGGAADVVMAAMLKLARNARLAALGWRMLLQVHDEVVLEGPAESAVEAKALVVADMEAPFAAPLRVDLIVDAKVVQAWGDAK